MTRICYIFLVLLVVSSCSVKEVREECPAFLGLTVTSQYDFIFHEGKAWCNLFDEDGTRFENSPLEEMNRRDSTLWYRIFPRKTVSAVVSNREIVAGCVITRYGEEMTELYAFREDIACISEEVTEVIYKQNKQFCNLTVQLAEEAMSFAPQLNVRVDCPYDGSSFPSMKAHSGDYVYSTIFDAKGTAVLRLPRQGGEGLRLTVQKVNGFTSSYDLFDNMKMARYNWNAESLDDYLITINLNSVTGDFVIVDWNIVDMGNREF